MAAYWLCGTPPRNTSVSVPRLTPDRMVRTTTSSRPGAGSATGRIAPQPGARSQNACALACTGFTTSRCHDYRRSRATNQDPLGEPDMLVHAIWKGPLYGSAGFRLSFDARGDERKDGEQC